MKGHIATIVGYVAVTLLTQATSHFLVFSSHYAAVQYIKAEPIFAFGIASMIIQGAILSYVYAGSGFFRSGVVGALGVAWLFGAFLVSYIALAEAAKYAVPDVSSWIGVEVLVGAIQFSLIGLVLHFAHGQTKSSSALEHN